MKLSTVCLVVAVVLAVAGGVIYSVRTSPIPDQTTGYVNTDPKLGSPPERTISYEASGPAGASITVSYLDENLRNHVVTAVLPWAQSVRTAAPAVTAAVVVQSPAAGIGCRIAVDGTTRDEQSSNSPGAATSCRVAVA